MLVLDDPARPPGGRQLTLPAEAPLIVRTGDLRLAVQWAAEDPHGTPGAKRKKAAPARQLHAVVSCARKHCRCAAHSHCPLPCPLLSAAIVISYLCRRTSPAGAPAMGPPIGPPIMWMGELAYVDEADKKGEEGRGGGGDTSDRAGEADD